MEQSDIEDAAMFLLHLRTQRSQVTGMPGELAPKTIDDAYDIQDAMHRFAGWPIEMCKVGCTSEVAQQVLGIPHPVGGRIPAEGVFQSGATVPRSFLADTPVLECEIAMRIGADGEVDAAAPAIEIVNGRFTDITKAGGLAMIADNVAGTAAILGEAVSMADVGDLSQLAISLRAGNDEIATGSGAAILGGPQASVAWTVDHEATRGRALEAGTWIITGTCTGLTPTNFDTTYTADFGSLGAVTFTLD